MLTVLEVLLCSTDVQHSTDTIYTLFYVENNAIVVDISIVVIYYFELAVLSIRFEMLFI